MKYLDTQICFQEFPNEISLCINITGCPHKCPGCHSPELWEDVGTELNQHELSRLIDKNKGITLIGFMGGEPSIINTLAAYIKRNYPLNIGWYTGNTTFEGVNINNFDYIKVGPYIAELGGLDSPTTNQKMYYIKHNSIIDSEPINITYKFWKK